MIQIDREYYNYLLDIVAMKCTTGAKLVVNHKLAHAQILFENAEYQNEFDEYLRNLDGNKEPDERIIYKTLLLLRLDWDGDVIELDRFIAARDSVINGG